MRKDGGLWVSAMVLCRQITALPWSRYEVRLIHAERRQPYPGVRRWTASRLCDPATVGFLRIRNREGYDVYFRPYAGDHNAGYILLDLDRPAPGIFDRLRGRGHEPSVVTETSPGRWQAWIRVSRESLAPPLATAIARHLAAIYEADRASADWRHLGRLAGFTNRKAERRQGDGLAPWVKLLYARPCLARDRAALLDCAAELASSRRHTAAAGDRLIWRLPGVVSPTAPEATALRTLYQAWLHRLRILERYPSPDWSIADQWVASALLRTGTPLAAIAAVLRHGSPGFPRRHADPEDYLRRTIRYAVRQVHSPVFPARIHSLT